MKNTQKYYEVALPLNIKQNFIYSSPLDLKIGESVFVPLRNKTRSAVILKNIHTPPPFKTKAILSKDSSRNPISPARLKWLYWLSHYYHHNIGPVIHLNFSAGPRVGGDKGCGLVLPKNHDQNTNPQTVTRLAGRRVGGDKGCGLVLPKNHDQKTNPQPTLSQTTTPKPPLTKEQKTCLQEIQKHKGFRTHLLHGVTGSGKTEVFFRLIEPSLQQEKKALILVPEIALTPQHIKRFSDRFPNKVACFHSHLSSKKKHLQWMSLLNGEKQILIGPRSALFCPLPQLAWIIVDEEHTGLFKQEEKLKYHGRDSAVYLAQCLNIPIVLASATPSLESYQNAQTGKYLYHSLKKPVFLTSSAKIKLVNMKEEQKSDLPYWLSHTLYLALKTALKNKEQSALFLNRRGENTYIFCSLCSYSFFCVNCDIALTQHQKTHLLCHYCGFRQEKPSLCPKCQKGEIISFGVGTATLQKELERLFPSARIQRADRDQVKTHKQWTKMLEQIENQEIDILIGTQMISKGLDFPHLNLVGLILADQGLNWPDFRAEEKTFQLIMQMAGRAGRRKTPGQVILQSHNPSHPVIKALVNRDWTGFANRALKYRKKHGYPPFGKLSLVRTQSVSANSALKVAEKLRNQLKNIKDLKVLGPAPATHARLKNQYRYHLLLKSKEPNTLKQAGIIINNQPATPRVRIHINRDPIYMF